MARAETNNLWSQNYLATLSTPYPCMWVSHKSIIKFWTHQKTGLQAVKIAFSTFCYIVVFSRFLLFFVFFESFLGVFGRFWSFLGLFSQIDSIGISQQNLTKKYPAFGRGI